MQNQKNLFVIILSKSYMNVLLHYLLNDIHAFFYKNILYKNVKDEIGQKIKNVGRICPS